MRAQTRKIAVLLLALSAAVLARVCWGAIETFSAQKEAAHAPLGH